MKKIMILLLLALTVPARSNAQTQEVTQLILNLEKLRELRKILQELKKGYDILFEGYTKIRDISRGNFKLHEAFLDGLLQVSPAVKNYGRIKDIVQMQLAIAAECRSAPGQLSASGVFSAKEMDYLVQVYSELTAESLKNLDALLSVVTAKKLRASDDERLSMIDAIYQDVSDQLIFLRHFSSNNSVLAAQRKDEEASVKTMQNLYDIKP
ncbi:TerB family tellurite resistance protein [Dyadobacter sp. CY261]|uniref:TerB family tellurite resistance protein n=1 Tax=Dyadobacter sp. CY261 TaxID=2907203 RepID=UPI001F33E5A9|nr:TerB family tellurite resistance protein [Dyadobacter sp. CY261]MCF0075399.1 TerB family tellurite resistance protein [Dyadobacter sp. CY261]